MPALDQFYLVGGTALALQLGHRVSVDLDLFSTEPFDPQTLPILMMPSGLPIRWCLTNPSHGRK
ncbi:MAG: nucleotidyl transferase AbiEii/AbiGii toxin family protein [Saprospiraceae bacterium]